MTETKQQTKSKPSIRFRRIVAGGSLIPRRHFIQGATAAALGGWTAAWAAEKRPRRIVLRSSWQTVNIGDIAHTPGVLTLLEKHLPDVEVRLWPSTVDNGVDAMLAKRFPKVSLVQGEAALKAAFDECDFLLHGSGPSLVAPESVAKWRKETGKPYGIYGITFASTSKSALDLLTHASFVLFRDSVSLTFAKDHGVKCPLMEFGPDGAFATDLRNDAAAEAFLEANGLEQGKFLCCLSRFRYTPYWLVKKGRPFEEKKHARNQEMKEHDHAPLREAIIAVVRETPLKVLLCPEDATQMAIGKEMLYDRLPSEVRKRVVWREKYWLTDEALSTYVRSAGIFGSEMHSPIMCIGNGIPAIVCRWAEQTSKGIMWRDIGLGDWLFDLDVEEEIPRIVPTVLAMAKDPVAAKAQAARARAFVEQRQRETMSLLGNVLKR